MPNPLENFDALLFGLDAVLVEYLMHHQLTHLSLLTLNILKNDVETRHFSLARSSPVTRNAEAIDLPAHVADYKGEGAYMQRLICLPVSELPDLEMLARELKGNYRDNSISFGNVKITDGSSNLPKLLVAGYAAGDIGLANASTIKIENVPIPFFTVFKKTAEIANRLYRSSGV
ncbi:MAG: hypothetical protein HGA85_09220, partial [Nanoarchaeota archaeon]|nr:hypothetical protein [Nanoarchaeota archaeon]